MFNDTVTNNGKSLIMEYLRQLMTLVLSTLLVGTIHGAESRSMPKVYHVAGDAGSDQHSGLEKSAAFRTLSAASQVMRPGDTCIIYEGVYRETLRPSTNGTSWAPVTFKAAPGEKVILSGLDKIDKWERTGDNTFKAHLSGDPGANLMVFQDGKVLTEARWPNRKNDSFFEEDIAIAETEGSSFDRIRCNAFPSHWNESDLNGATVWCMAMARWASWTAPVKMLLKNEQTLVVDGHDTWWVKERHNPGKDATLGVPRPADFFVSNAKVLLDAPGEWFFDKPESSLYVFVDRSDDPNQVVMEVNTRPLAIDLSGLKYIAVEGFELVGASVSMNDSEYCTLSRINARHIFHTRGGFTAMQVPEAVGFQVSGKHNAIVHCEISRSSGSGITLSGSHNVLFNNFVHHTNSIGAYCVAVRVSGYGHDIIHNTISISGRDGLGIKGKSHCIKYNDISWSGKVCYDTGAMYGGANDGENTEISHNWVHDVQTFLGAGIYFDSYSSNYNIHHNVMWNISHSALQLNQPSNYMIVSNNTIFDGALDASYGAGNVPKSMFGSLVANNLFAGKMELKPGYIAKANHSHNVKTVGKLFNPNEVAFNVGRGAGWLIPGVNQRTDGSDPDCGAHESGQIRNFPGHNFTYPPFYNATRSAAGFFRNYIRNGSFGYKEDFNDLADWAISGQVESTYFEGYIADVDSRNTIHANGLVLSGNDPSAAKQLVRDLKSGTKFAFAGYVKIESAQDVAFKVHGSKGELASSRYSLSESGAWRHVEVQFTVPPMDDDAIVVEILKIGPGIAYIDNVGLCPVVDP